MIIRSLQHLFTGIIGIAHSSGSNYTALAFFRQVAGLVYVTGKPDTGCAAAVVG
ncbi:MAG: hypothetical protein LBC70_04470 [Chitinispirillales bacterium]|nr:hypothetical protein [Chitinispirillales bacterium]